MHFLYLIIANNNRLQEMKVSKNFGMILGPLMFFVILLFFHPSGLNDQSNAVLAATIWIAIWWIFEALPIALTALLPIVLFPIAGRYGSCSNHCFLWVETHLSYHGRLYDSDCDRKVEFA